MKYEYIFLKKDFSLGYSANFYIIIKAYNEIQENKSQNHKRINHKNFFNKELENLFNINDSEINIYNVNFDGVIMHVKKIFTKLLSSTKSGHEFRSLVIKRFTEILNIEDAINENKSNMKTNSYSKGKNVINVNSSENGILQDNKNTNENQNTDKPTIINKELTINSDENNDSEEDNAEIPSSFSEKLDILLQIDEILENDREFVQIQDKVLFTIIYHRVLPNVPIYHDKVADILKLKNDNESKINENSDEESDSENKDKFMAANTRNLGLL